MLLIRCGIIRRLEIHNKLNLVICKDKKVIKSPLDLKNLNITDLIIHRVYLPGQQAHFDVEHSNNIIPLSGKAKQTLEQRLTKVLSKGSKCIEMDIVEDDPLEKYILCMMLVRSFLYRKPKISPTSSVKLKLVKSIQKVSLSS
ncbi:hypothetical protein SEEACDC4_04381 [Salmonella enterica subsp. enterica serovar Agona str. SA-4]|nr:hypothetical protein SEEACDC4_04381 [Salmonella enterica subsp. enterica serovar Agona str. SA-4]